MEYLVREGRGKHCFRLCLNWLIPVYSLGVVAEVFGFSGSSKRITLLLSTKPVLSIAEVSTKDTKLFFLRVLRGK